MAITAIKNSGGGSASATYTVWLPLAVMNEGADVSNLDFIPTEQYGRAISDQSLLN